ncbi:MAG TPA: hypothetical protein VF719_09675 [Abditibacteriaceae bacterium]
MRIPKGERIVSGGGAVGAFALATTVLLYVRAASPRGLVHDSAYSLFWLGLLAGGWCGALFTWLVMKYFIKHTEYELRGRFIGTGGCFGAMVAWLPFVVLLRLLLPWNP